jgi:hypothetical protein
MRTIALVLAAFVASGPAAAQDWKEYSYPDYSFTVAFPAAPQIEQRRTRPPTAARSQRTSIRCAKTIVR